MQANSMAPMIHQSVPVETHDQHHLRGLLPAHFRQQIPFGKFVRSNRHDHQHVTAYGPF